MADDEERKEFDWDLHVNVPTIGVHRTLRVTSNESIGAVMIKLATKLGGYGLLNITVTSIIHVRVSNSLAARPLRHARGRTWGSGPRDYTKHCILEPTHIYTHMHHTFSQ